MEIQVTIRPILVELVGLLPQDEIPETPRIMNLNKGILPKGFTINSKYSIMLFIKQGTNAETYRVIDSSGNLYFLKLFNYAKTHRSAFDNDKQPFGNRAFEKSKT